MNLILQGLDGDSARLERIAALAAPTSITRLGPNAVRCEQIAYSPALRPTIEVAAQAAQLDATYMMGQRELGEFKLVAMDMDSTLITIECIDEIADMQGLKPQVAAITEAAMRGELDFSSSLKQRVALLEGLDASALQRVYDERLKLSPGAEAMLAAVQKAGLKTLLVSGGFTFFTERLKERLGLDYTHANELEIVDGKLTGKVLGGIVDAEEKQRTVERVCAELGISPSEAIVMGDGANDLKMMGIAGLSVAFRAKPVVRSQADVALNFVGLDGLLNVLT
ncbi:MULTISPECIES: phosphoserine phosphatase SerB [unclassified Janthinobacterium]|uniref:phosphoserine phosphatase SerB n=1 Tax=unclassified Janthinobacterium TaxID=2610881 RepID=UPI0025B60E0B|nr:MULTISPECIES: phosphoserine phosphatase SerB [unclassified Janthinobacterium]MDN2701395.1 phosphoserine phosphatase SerB [Janthinobacterium sp. SUN100]MDN2713590.1 phosphoserine phosphatase SerB [Janthinobacterium sp. SUN120]MDO8039307.1 phosphoserine phosphatase SerB [Janthinobacterium sp. SUN137]MDO8047877.1 phosphoserine phosphatase SerB [Janthinobacterium sp. SUN211]MDO8065408.1 phosphoserine phosphatase SerB [Janthinobacterium sp. SUN206]